MRLSHLLTDLNLGSLTSETCSQSEGRKDGKEGGEVKTVAGGMQDTTATSEGRGMAVSTGRRVGPDEVCVR